ncbi:MAG: hypothetical protein KA419_01185 [Acidobacteria bacterium]|nr:hypothetical protein [Acidobacteriota bacterium]
MTRKDFLRLLGLSAAGLFVPGKLLAADPKPTAPPGDAVPAGGRLFRGTADGRILQSLDGGKVWTLHADLGETNAVRRIYVEDGLTRAEISSPGGTFVLTLHPKGKAWVVLAPGQKFAPPASDTILK